MNDVLGLGNLLWASGAKLALFRRRRPRPVRVVIYQTGSNSIGSYTAYLRMSMQNFRSIDQSQLEQDGADCLDLTRVVHCTARFRQHFRVSE